MNDYNNKINEYNCTDFIHRCSKLIFWYLFTLTDNEILRVLNEGTIKELKKLQGVGQKRAKLIADWRTVHGPFQQVNLSQKMAFMKLSLLW